MAWWVPAHVCSPFSFKFFPCFFYSPTSKWSLYFSPLLQEQKDILAMLLMLDKNWHKVR